MYIYGISFWGGGEFPLSLGLVCIGYLMCGQVAFGVGTEIPGPLFYGTVKVEYDICFEKVLKSGLGLFLVPSLFLHELLLFLSRSARQTAFSIHGVGA